MMRHSNVEINFKISAYSLEDWFTKIDQKCTNYEEENWCLLCLRGIIECHNIGNVEMSKEFNEILNRYHEYRKNLRLVWCN